MKIPVMKFSHLKSMLIRAHRRPVSTWSSLSVAFNSKPERKLNLNFGRKNVGLFQIAELKDYTGFYLLQQNAQMEAEQLVKEATDPHRRRKLVQIFDELSDCLCKVADMADFMRIAHPEKQYAQAAEDACMSISALVEKLNTNVDIYKSLKKVLENGDVVKMDDIDKRVGQLFLFDFEQSGIHLEQQKRDKFVGLNEKNLMLASLFAQGAQQPIAIPKSQLPKEFQSVFNVVGDNVMVTGFIADQPSDRVRETAYRIYMHPDPRQIELLESLLSTRNELAKSVGFPSYAHRTLRGTLANSPENVREFLTTLAERIEPLAREDFTELFKVKVRHSRKRPDPLMPWDVAYYGGLARHQMCKINSADLAPYLSLGGCMDGLSQLFQQLYGVSLQYCQPEYGEVWSDDVHKLAVVHENEGVLGYIYCDFYERLGKPHQDCHFTIQGGREREDGTYQLPIVALMLNLPCSRGNTPPLLSPGMVENLFHEFGHAMHSMLGRAKYQHVTGTRCSTDFAEVPSVLMEYFATDYRVLCKFAKHYSTGEPISENMVKNLYKARKLASAADIQQQVFYALVDQEYHAGHLLGKSTTEVLEELQSKYYSLPHVPKTAWQLRFGHFAGYGAKYYSYLYSKAVASRIWRKCFKDDPFNREMGDRYRYKMLAAGGGIDPAELIQDMLGENPTTGNLVEAVMNELVESR